MTETFKVGDKVIHRSWGAGEIVFGPYNGDALLMKEDGGDVIRHVEADAMTPRPAFAIGDTVKYEYGDGGKLVAGPFKSGYHDEAIWVVERANGTHITPTENSLTKVPPTDYIRVGDRVRVLVAAHMPEMAGCMATVREVGTDETFADPAASGVHRFLVRSDDQGTFYARDVEKVDEPAADTFAYAGVTYDLSASYRDKDGDTWHFVRFGDVVEGGIYGAPKERGDGDSLRYVVDEYGPLTRI